MKILVIFRFLSKTVRFAEENSNPTLVLRVVLDTSIYISAFLFGREPEALLRLDEEGEIELYISPPIYTEIKRILLKKFLWSQPQVDLAIRKLSHFAHLVRPQKHIVVVKDDPDDDRILECAIAAQSTILVSGDKALLQVRLYQGISIISPREFFDQYGGSVS